jgi:Fur family peroxide stress response transcriptional regulator
MQFDAVEFRRLCGEHGLAVTHQRQVIYQALMSMHDHPSPEVVYEKVRKQIPSISLGTVYKNIKTFVDSGMLREVSLHHGSTRLETNLAPHHHLVCVRCKTIVDLDDHDLEPVRLNKRLPRGFSVQRYSVEVIGLCTRCSS